MPFDYVKSQFEHVSCNLCGRDDFFVLAEKTKNELMARTCVCNNCGLIYLSPRMTKESYGDYYRYFYRQDRSEIKHKEESGEEENFQSARRFGEALARRFSAFIQSGPTVDVGSSTGGVLAGMRDVVPSMQVFGIEPSLAESEYAREKGIETHTGLFEDFSTKDIGSISQIVCVQSLNHLLDPRRFFEWSYEHLKDGGHLILSVKDFRYQCRRSGRVEAGVQIDHPYMFTPETLKLFVESVGFRVVSFEYDEKKTHRERMRQRNEGLSHHHIRLVGRREGAKTFLSRNISAPKTSRKIRRQLWGPALRLRYLLRYSRRTEPFRKLLYAPRCFIKTCRE